MVNFVNSLYGNRIFFVFHNSTETDVFVVASIEKCDIILDGRTSLSASSFFNKAIKSAKEVKSMLQVDINSLTELIKIVVVLVLVVKL